MAVARLLFFGVLLLALAFTPATSSQSLASSGGDTQAASLDLPAVQMRQLSNRRRTVHRHRPMCRQAERKLSRLGSRVAGWARMGNAIKWTKGNVYSESKIANNSKLCFYFRVPSARTYRIKLTGKRTTDGRTSTGCSHSDKEGSLATCKRRSGRTCVCNDEENDVWMSVSGQHAQLGTPANTFLKAMLDCPWDETCTRWRVNVNHKMFESDYRLGQGGNVVCIAGRSTRTYLDSVCIEPL